jgi:hypothetical protein
MTLRTGTAGIFSWPAFLVGRSTDTQARISLRRRYGSEHAARTGAPHISSGRKTPMKNVARRATAGPRSRLRLRRRAGVSETVSETPRATGSSVNATWKSADLRPFMVRLRSACTSLCVARRPQGAVAATALGVRAPSLSLSLNDVTEIVEYRWPMNVRELEQKRDASIRWEWNYLTPCGSAPGGALYRAGPQFRVVHP